MGRDDPRQTEPQLLISSRDYFQEIVSDALEQRRVKTLPFVQSYLVELLEFYVPAANLFDEPGPSGNGRKKRSSETLAETYLRAQNAEPLVRIELLKRLGDRSLYISGFFADSLQRKLVDVDYYIDMGGLAYSTLAESVREDTVARIYRECASRFLEFVEVLSYISTRAKLVDEENIMRLYETYARTGSDYAREQLLEKGLIAVPVDAIKNRKGQ